MGIVSEVLTEKYDGNYQNTFFPFFSWSLFKRIPNKFSDYGVLVVSIDGKRLEGVNYFQDLNFKFQKAKSVDGYYAIQKMGRALEHQNFKEFNKARILFETYYIGEAKTVKYSIVKRSYIPLKKTITYKIYKKLGDFESNTTDS